MAKQVLRDGVQPTKTDWKKRRPEQEYSHREVQREMLRRHSGEYTLSRKDRDAALATGEIRIRREFRLAALLSDYLRDEAMSVKELAELLGAKDAADTLDVMLNPYYRTIDSDGSVFDRAYPGTDVRRAR